ncbi:hypothetical protein D3C84_1164540 [compost metagenome]
MRAAIVFFKSSICVYTRYQGTSPPLNSIVKNMKNEKKLLCGKSLREMGYAYSDIITRLIAVPTVAKKTEIPKERKI